MDKLKLFVGIFFASLFLLFFLSPMDPDLGWHLRCGENFWSSGSFCGENSFSVLLPNYSWPNHAWLYDAVLFPVFNIGGFFGLSFFNAFLILGSFLFLYFSVKDKKIEKTLLILLISIFGWGVFSLGIRSQLFGVLFFSIEIFLFSKFKENEKIIFLFPLLFLVWANFHGSVIIGILLFGFVLIGKFIDIKKFQLKQIFIFFISILTPLINPFGMKIYTDAWRHFAVVDLGKLIAEWTPPGFFVGIVIVFTGIIIIFLSLKNPILKNKIYSLLILGVGFSALKARRNLPLYFMILFLVFFEFQDKRDFFNRFFERDSVQKILLILASLFFVILLVFYLIPNVKADLNYNNWCLQSSDLGLNYPCKGVEFLNSLPPGNIFNTFEWGGFLIWKIPQNKIFVDGRMPAWETPLGKSPYTVYLETIQTQSGWQETLKEYNFSYLFIGSGTFMDLELKVNHEKEGWNEIYRDNFSVIYKKVNLTNIS